MRSENSGGPSIGLSIYWPCFAVVLCIVLLMACNARERGCLDIEATNFDIEAERADNSVCEYPELYLDVVYAWGTEEVFIPSEFYMNSLGQLFSVNEFHYLFSQFSIQRQDAVDLTVAERTQWYLKESGNVGTYIEAIDDFVYVDRSRFQFELGTTEESGYANTYQFWTSVPDSLTPTVVDSTSPLSKIQDSRALYDEELEQFASARFVVEYGMPATWVDTFIIYDNPFLHQHSIDKQLNQGFTDTLRIGLQFKELFDDLNLDSPRDTIVEHLRKSLKSSVIDNN